MQRDILIGVSQTEIQMFEINATLNSTGTETFAMDTLVRQQTLTKTVEINQGQMETQLIRVRPETTGISEIQKTIVLINKTMV